MNEADPHTEFATRGAELVSRMGIVIAEWTVGDTPSPGALLAAVLGELAQAAFVLARLEADVDADETEEELTGTAAAFFAALSATALTATARIHPETRDDPPLRSHGPLLRWLDDDVSEWLERQSPWDEDDYRLEHSPSYWLRTVTSLLVGAADGVAGLEGRSRRPFTTADDGSPDDDPDPDAVATAIADSLYQASITAAAGAGWFADRFSELRTP